MLYVMITRRLPFDAATDYETLMLVKSGDYLPPEDRARPGLNRSFYRVIRKAMSKSPTIAPEGRGDAARRRAGHAPRLRPVARRSCSAWLRRSLDEDGVPPLTRETPPAPDTSSTSWARRSAAAASRAARSRGWSSIWTTRSRSWRASPRRGPTRRFPAPYPQAGPTEVMTPPAGHVRARGAGRGDRVGAAWYRRRAGIAVGAVGLVLALVVTAKAFTRAACAEPQAAAPATPG